MMTRIRIVGTTLILSCIGLSFAAGAADESVTSSVESPEARGREDGGEEGADSGNAALANQARWALGLGQRNRGGHFGFYFDGSLVDAVEFFRPHPSGNGRSCATCHRPEDNFGLTPRTVEARWQLLQFRRQFDPNADDPLFRSIDADDFDQDFTTLRTKALVRVTLPLPPNVKITSDPAATTTSVWRAVPTVMNAKITAPFQNDGRRATLEEQALGAMREHSQITEEPSAKTLSRLADFQRHLFSSKRVRELARAMDNAETLPNTDPPLNALEQQGKMTFDNSCASCHGGPTLTVNRDARFLPVPSRGPVTVGAQAFVNIFVQTPRPPPPAAPPPAPPTPEFFAGLPSAELPQVSYSVALPNNTQALALSSDPGRMLVTGDFRENGRFDIPTLFGIGRTAPYFHDNSAATLEQVIDHYQAMFKFIRFLDVESGFFAPPANGQGCAQGTCGIESIPEAEIPGLIAYLRRL